VSGIAHPDGSILEEFDIAHNDAGFEEFFCRVEEHRQRNDRPADGETLSTTTNATVKHTYSSGAPSHTYVVTLTVIDEQGLTDSAVRNVTVTN